MAPDIEGAARQASHNRSSWWAFLNPYLNNTVGALVIEEANSVIFMEKYFMLFALSRSWIRALLEGWGFPNSGSQVHVDLQCHSDSQFAEDIDKSDCFVCF